MRYSIRLLLAGLLFISLGAAVAPAQINSQLVDGNSLFANGGTCTPLDIVGTYMVSCTGLITVPPGVPGNPTAGAMTLGYSGLGVAVTDVSGYARAPNVCVNVGGQVMLAGVEGQTQVNATNCTGTVRYYPFGYNRSLGSAFNPNNWLLYIRFVILKGGQELRGILIGQQDPAANFAPVPTAPVQCELKLIQRGALPQTLDPGFCAVPPTH